MRWIDQVMEGHWQKFYQKLREHLGLSEQDWNTRVHIRHSTVFLDSRPIGTVSIDYASRITPPYEIRISFTPSITRT